MLTIRRALALRTPLRAGVRSVGSTMHGSDPNVRALAAMRVQQKTHAFTDSCS
jgi:hypothetical protein